MNRGATTAAVLLLALSFRLTTRHTDQYVQLGIPGLAPEWSRYERATVRLVRGPWRTAGLSSNRLLADHEDSLVRAGAPFVVDLEAGFGESGFQFLRREERDQG